jgi:uncharacterized integral membrane protein
VGVMVCIALPAFVGPVVFVAQNSGSARLSFLSLHDQSSIMIALAAIAVCGWTLVFLFVRAARTLRLRRTTVHRGR